MLRLCNHCGAKFEGPLRQRYCSITCAALSRWNGITCYSPVGRICRGCNKTLPWSEFPKPRGSGATCKNCTRLKKYDLTQNEWVALYEKQQGRCAGCKKSFDYEVEDVVDHCHIDGHVRGLLCAACNTTLGNLNTVEKLEAATHYLERHHARLGVTPPPLPD